MDLSALNIRLGYCRRTDQRSRGPDAGNHLGDCRRIVTVSGDNSAKDVGFGGRCWERGSVEHGGERDCALAQVVAGGFA